MARSCSAALTSSTPALVVSDVRLPGALFAVDRPESSFSLSARVDGAEKQIIEEALGQCRGKVAETPWLL